MPQGISDIRFNMNTQKAIEAVLWIIHKGESNMYNIWKVLFTAEQYHLNKYGRPITGDRYMAMEYGTVPSWLYDASKMKRQGLGFYKDNNSLIAERAPATAYLSKSDCKALEFGLKAYKGLGFKEVMKKNHKEPAWIKNYNSRGDNDSAPIPFEDMIKEEWLKEDLYTLSANMVL
jgi:uncharacterized phage-associated protein